MNDEQIALARRAVACRGWKWMPGMLTLDSDLILRVDDDGYKFAWRKFNFGYSPPADALPDLQDPATLGCLLALVREAWACPSLYVMHEHEGMDRYQKGRPYSVSCGDGTMIVGVWTSEAEALVAALEAAPCGQ